MVVIPENKKVEILLIEDKQQEAEMIRESFEQRDACAHVSITKTCAEALNFLYKKEQFANTKRPDLILLDTGVAKKEGREFLDNIKHNAVLKVIPVIVLADSYEDYDVIMSYALQANAHILKPVESEKFQTVLHQIQSFWLHTATLV